MNHKITKKRNFTKIEVSTANILTLFAICLLLIFVYSIRNVLVMLFFAFILSSTLIPLVKILVSYKIPQSIAVTIIYLSVIMILITLISIVSAPLIKESIRLVNNLPDIMVVIIDTINAGVNKIGFEQEVFNDAVIKNGISTWVNSLTQDMGNLVTAGSSGISGIFRIISGMFGGIITILTVLTISVYITLDHDNFVNTLVLWFPNPASAKKIKQFILSVEEGLGRWLRGQVTLSIFIGIITWLLLTILKIPYAVPLALLATILNSIPHFGSTIAAVPALIIAFTTGNIIQVILVALGYIIVQQFENNVLGPKIFANAIGLPPVIIILALLIGAQLYGFTGILLAVPVAAVIQTCLDFWFHNKTLTQTSGKTRMKTS